MNKWREWDIRLNKLMNDIIADFREAGIEVGSISHICVNARLRRAWGQCCRCRTDMGTEYFYIEISTMTLNSERLRDVVAHEILHTVSGCFNHGVEFLALAGLMKSHGYQIDVADSAPEMGMDAESIYKYIVRCENGHNFYRHRMCDLVKTPCRYRCGCGANLKRIK